MPTIKDVAKEAGVSIASVSKVLNNPDCGSIEMRAKVMAAIRKLGYQPSNIARSMVKGKTNLIALVIPDVRNQFFTLVARGVEDVASKHDYRVMLCNTDEDPAKERKYIDVFRGKIVDGFIISVASDTDRYLSKINMKALPFVFIDRVCEGIPADAIILDNKGGAYKAINYLLGLGHRRIGLITGKQDTLPGRERLHGYLKAYKNLGIEYSTQIIKDGGFTIEGGYKATKALLALKDRPSAIFVTNNAMTIGCLKALAQAGIRVPEDISVVGFDDPEWAEFFTPPLTMVNQPTYTMGVLAGEMLFQRILGKIPPERQEVILKSELVIRKSCRQVSVGGYDNLRRISHLT